MLRENFGNALDLLSIQSFWQEIIEGLILVIVVAIDVLLKKNTERPTWLSSIFTKRSGGPPLPDAPSEARPPDPIGVAQESNAG